MLLKIRDEQMKIFEQAAQRNFAGEMVGHVRQFAPRHSKIIGEHGVRQVVGMGMERARRYGLNNRGPVRFYIELMFMLGSDFDTDPQYPWASEVLNESNCPDQSERADRLFRGATDYFEKVSGPGNKHEMEAMRRATRIRFEDLPTLKGSNTDELVNHLNGIHRQKCKYIGRNVLMALIQRGEQLAKERDLSHGAGTAVFVCLMFLFGHGCFTDPMFPWIEEKGDAPITDPREKASNLYSRMGGYLANALASMEKS
jgi:hypothetical protein